MLRFHRLFAFLFLPVLLYVVLTGAGTEFWDMVALVGHASETSPDMLRMREHIDGPPNYAVLSARDYTAPALPANLDATAAAVRAARLGRAAVPGGSLRLVELRSYEGRLAGHVQMNDRQLVFDLASGKRLPDDALPGPQASMNLYAPRAAFKSWHRLMMFGNLGTIVNAVAGIGLAAMMITGLVQYGRLYRARSKVGRTSPFWGGKSRWRTLHRSISLLAVLPILWLAISGFALAIDNIVPGLEGIEPGPPIPGGPPDPFFGDFSKPMSDGELGVMVRSTLGSFHAQEPGIGFKVLRLRYFSGYSQGVVISAKDNRQLVYNTHTGARMSMNEPGYPKLSYPTGWEWHQRLKRIHRGDFLGTPGRWLASFAAISLLYLLISGTVMYVQLYRRRLTSGRSAPIW